MYTDDIDVIIHRKKKIVMMLPACKRCKEHSFDTYDIPKVGTYCKDCIKKFWKYLEDDEECDYCGELFYEGYMLPGYNICEKCLEEYKNDVNL